MDIREAIKILEIPPDATPDDIKRQYKDLVNIWHPDRFCNNPRLCKKAEDRLKEINEAYETISSALTSGSLDQEHFYSKDDAEAQSEEPPKNTGYAKSTRRGQPFDGGYPYARAKPKSFWGTIFKLMFFVSLISSSIVAYKHKEFVLQLIKDPSGVVDTTVNRALFRSSTGGIQLQPPHQPPQAKAPAPQPPPQPPKPRTRTFVEIHMNSGSIITADSYKIDGDMIVYRVSSGTMGVARSKVKKIEVKTVNVR